MASHARQTDPSTPAEHGNVESPRSPEAGPDNPIELPKGSWKGTLKRALHQIGHDQLSDRAAALTYYGVQSLFPGALVLVAILGLFGRSTTQSVMQNLQSVAPGPIRDFIQSVVGQAQSRGQGAAGLAAIIGIVLAIWSASGYVSAFMRAANTVYGVGEGRTFVKKTGTRLGVTVVTVILLVISAAIVVFTGSFASDLGKALGIGHAAVLAWEIVKWPVLVVLVSLMFSLLYWATPNVKQPGFKWITPGGFLAVLIWAAASGLFAVYVANFGSYSKTYGSLAGIIIALVWLWLTNFAILLGLEFNAETERAKAIAAGMPEDVEPYVELRDTKKLDPEARQDLQQARQAAREAQVSRSTPQS